MRLQRMRLILVRQMKSLLVSGDVTITEAQSIQNLSGYDASASAYEIEDSAAVITASNDQLMQNGNIHVDVTDANVNASVGAI